MNYVYILECSDGTFYTGWTNDLEKRIRMHSEGKGAKYTKGRGPLKLVHCEEFESRSDAMRREYEIKQLKRSEKILLIKNYME
ncbi:GIY-YIG nuclease family protein [Clostridium sp. SM-530-WT-3G]|mgnify:FL=1|uniref:GIY-YIG nuclease family protein n=1 Tax=Clostridium sp. SM-530-WT-3G TaxID=2725303 RepID=UPI00145CF531|nr:GIY-YIG nuclease family protein [Clostridium sp. SM-530-WT-3G]